MKKRVQKTFYEWKLELIDRHSDIVDSDFEDNLSEHNGALWRQFIEGPRKWEDANIVRYDLCLSRKYYSHNEACLRSAIKQGFAADDLEYWDLEDTSYAYIENGKLPKFFDWGDKVPERFHREIAKLNLTIVEEGNK